MEFSDNVYVDAVNKGDVKKFDKLIDKYSDKIFRLAYGIVGNAQEAEDMVQEVFLKAYKNLSKFRGDANFGTWLYRITVNHCLGKLRGKKRLKTAPLEYQDPEGSPDEYKTIEIEDMRYNPEEKFLGKELREKLFSVIGKIPVENRMVIILRDIEEYTNEEVGQMLHLSVPTVKSRLHRARAFVRGKMEKYLRGTGEPYAV